ncbi:MAG: hypothetical protein J2P28_13675 [Actinobacteria bacterium]|nr:hypothetical protein [Actinomycetota bacterium]
MAMRVLATQTAEKAAQDLRVTLQALRGDTQRVLGLGNRLADTNLWDGPVAAEFRQVHWPRALASLQPTLQAVERLQASAQTVVNNILKAGGEGVAGGRPAGGSETEPWSVKRAKDLIVDPSLSSWAMLVAEPMRVRAGLNVVKAMREGPAVDKELAREWQQINYEQLQADRGEIPRELANQHAESKLNAYDAARTFAEHDAEEAAKAFREGGLAGNLAKADKALGPLAIASDAYTIWRPSSDALGGPNVERFMAAADLGATATTMLGLDVALGPIPGVGEVVLGGTALYMAGDLIYQNREVIGHALDTAGTDVAHVSEGVAKDAWGAAKSAWHSVTSFF